MKSTRIHGMLLALFLVLSAFVLTMPFSKAFYVFPLELSISSGAVGSTVTVTEPSQPNSVIFMQALERNYSIFFDINSNGEYEASELMKRGTTTSSHITDSFTIPSSVGSISGVIHNIWLVDDSGNNGEASFSVTTSRHMVVPYFVRAGNNITITVNLHGASSFESRQFGVRVIGPNFPLTSWYNFTLVTNATGSASRSVSYPAIFPNYSTATPGNYTFQSYQFTPTVAFIGSESVQVNAQPAPVATITSIAPSSGYVGQQIAFAGSGSDGNGSIVGYYWTSNITGKLSTNPSFNTTLPAGVHLISFYVQDADGLWSAPVARVVNVFPSDLASIIDSIVVDSSVTPIQVTFAGHGVDSAWQITNYRWETIINGTLTVLGTTKIFASTILPAGNYTISFQVQNSQGNWSTAARQQLTIKPMPGVPTAVIDSVDPNPAPQGQMVSFAGHGVMANGDIINYDWVSSLDGQLSKLPRFSTSTLSEGAHVISFTVQADNQAWSSPDTMTLNVGNSPPVAHIDRSVTPAKVLRNAVVNFAGSGTDSDGLIAGYSWDSDRDSHLSDAPSFSTSTLSVGVHTISFSVLDNQNAWSSPETLTIEVIVNQQPTATIDEIPSSAHQGDAITLRGHGSDSDGTVVAYRWTSSIDDQIGDTAELTTSSLSAGTHVITFEVQDDNGMWSLQDVRTLTVNGGGGGLNPTITLIAVASGTTAASALIGTTYYMGNLPRSARFNKDFSKKVEKEKQRQEKKKKKQEKEDERRRREGKPVLKLEGRVPKEIFSSLHEPAMITVKNTGSAEAKNILPTYYADSGITFTLASNTPFNLPPGKSISLAEPFTIDSQARRGTYRLFFQAGCQDAASPDIICLFRNFKIGLLTTPATSAQVEPLRAWIVKKGYSYDEIDSADDLRGTLNKYDLLIIAPGLKLTDRWIRNLCTFVKNSQALLAMDKTDSEQNSPMAAKLSELLGYENLIYKNYRTGSGQLEFTSSSLCADMHLSAANEVQMQSCTGNHCISKPIGNVLAYYNMQDDDVKARFPALVANVYGKAAGRVIHLNFAAQQAMSQLDSMLEKIFNWLLRVDELPTNQGSN